MTERIEMFHEVVYDSTAWELFYILLVSKVDKYKIMFKSTQFEMKEYPNHRFDTKLLVMSPSRAEGFSARLMTFFTSAGNRKLAKNKPKFDSLLKIYFLSIFIKNL